MGDVVQVDDGAQFPRFDKFFGGGIVRGEHDIFTDDARSLSDHDIERV